jgi:hypothetical protein
MFVILAKKNVLHTKSNIELNHILIDFFAIIPITTLDDHVLICKLCERKIKHGKPFDSNLRNHVMENKPNMNFVSMLNNIEECLITPCFAFAHIFHLGGHGQ